MPEPSLPAKSASTATSTSGASDASTPAAVAGAAPEPALGAGPGWRRRLRAALIHAAIGSVVIAGVLALIFGAWYRNPLAAAAGVGHIVALMLAADLLLGPLLTFSVFDPRKKSLKLDLAIIGCVQVAALVYGLHALDVGRPAWLVFVKDRFELIARADLRPEDLAAARENPFARTRLLGPKIVASVAPLDPTAYRDALMEAVGGGRDIQHRPDLYEDYAGQVDEAKRNARPIDELRRIDPDRIAAIDEGVAETGLPEAQLAYLPVRGPSADLAMLIDRKQGQPLLLVNARPWK